MHKKLNLKFKCVTMYFKIYIHTIYWWAVSILFCLLTVTTSLLDITMYAGNLLWYTSEFTMVWHSEFFQVAIYEASYVF